MKKLLFILSLFFFLSLMFVSCEKEQQEVITPISSEQLEMLDYFGALGYNVDSFEFKTDHVFYKRRVAWPMKDILLRARGEYDYTEVEDSDERDPDIIGERQRAISEDNRFDAVRASNVQNIFYYIDPSVWNNLSYSWRNAIDDAAESWNDLTYCRINFVPMAIRAFADIVITTDIDPNIPSDLRNLPSGVITATRGALNGEVGPILSINASYDVYLRKKVLIMGSLGHALGFEPTDGSLGEHVHGTPTTQTNSVMNASPWAASSTFQTGDKRMARLFYPQEYDRPDTYIVSRVGTGTVQIIYRNPNPINKPYYWVRVYKYSASGGYFGSRYFRSTPNAAGIHIIQWGGHGYGYFRFAVRGYNFRRDIRSSKTSRVYVNLY